jgi:predicted nucleotide-binding protein
MMEETHMSMDLITQTTISDWFVANMNRKVFVSHSNKFFALTTYFCDFLSSLGLTPIVPEDEPNEGRLWSVNEKVEYCMSICDSALLIATPDIVQDGNPVPRWTLVMN